MSRWVVQSFAAITFACIAASGHRAGVTVGGDHLARGSALLQAAAGEFQVEVFGQGSLG
ncbi:hypothetical protein D3C87_2153080 [compost metagenome]